MAYVEMAIDASEFILTDEWILATGKVARVRWIITTGLLAVTLQTSGVVNIMMPVLMFFQPIGWIILVIC